MGGFAWPVGDDCLIYYRCFLWSLVIPLLLCIHVLYATLTGSILNNNLLTYLNNDDTCEARLMVI